MVQLKNGQTWFDFQQDNLMINTHAIRTPAYK